MRLKSHIVAGAIGTAVFYPFFGPFQSILFFISSFMIDADHYLDYLWRNKFTDWSPSRMFRYYYPDEEDLHNPNNLSFAILHTVEAFLILYLLARYVNFDFFIPIIAGMAYHIIFDVLWATNKKVPTIRPFSIAEYFIRKYLMKKKGLDPDKFCQKRFQESALLIEHLEQTPKNSRM